MTLSDLLSARCAPPVVARAAMALLTLALYGGSALWLGWRLARLSAPALFVASPWSQPDPQAAASRVAQQHWFGVAMPAPAPPLQLSGVFAVHADGGPGFAVVLQDGRTRYLIAGQSQVQGWLVEQVREDGILLRHGAQQQFYPLPHGNGRGGEIGESAPPPALQRQGYE